MIDFLIKSDVPYMVWVGASNCLLSVLSNKEETESVLKLFCPEIGLKFYKRFLVLT